MEHSLSMTTAIVLQKLRTVSNPEPFKPIFHELDGYLTFILQDAEEKQVDVDAVLKTLLEELDKVMGQIDEHNSSWRRKVGNFFSSLKSVGAFHQIIRSTLDSKLGALKKMYEYPIVGGGCASLMPTRNFDFEFMLNSIDRSEEKKKFISHLLDDKLRCFNIFGNQSFWKTTFVKFVFNDKKIDRYFESKLWVTISIDMNVKQMILKLIYSISEEKQYSNKDQDQLAEDLNDICRSKSYLIVVDCRRYDQEHMDEWYGFLKILPRKYNENKCKMIAITREPFPVPWFRQMWQHEFPGFPDNFCRSLFLKVAFEKGPGKEQHPNLEEIGREIVRKCKGDPLAVITVGQLLQFTTEEEDWKRINRDIDEIWESGKDGISFSPALKLIYDQLPSQMKLCFLYCSFFPRDYEFHGFELVQFWKVNGLLPSSLNEDKDHQAAAEAIGMQYLQMLRSKAIFNDFEDENFDVKFKMQEPMHDVSLWVASGSSFGLRKHFKKSFRDQTARHLSFLSSDEEYGDHGFLKHHLDLVRTLMFFEVKGLPLRKSFVESFISRCQNLRTLVLKNSSFKKLPRGIDKLEKLKYLDLSANEIRGIPNSICKLRSLQTLMLQGCVEIGELPRDMRLMVGLTTLTITTKQNFLPENGIGCLSSLRYLAIIGCPSLSFLPQGIQFLKALGTLKIRDCHKLIKLPRSMKYLVALETLVIVNCKMLQLNTNRELKGIQDDHQDHLIGSGLSLKRLMIANVPELVVLPQLFIKRSANSLLHLHIKDCPKLENLPRWLRNLTSLTDLEILGCPLSSKYEKRQYKGNNASLQRFWIESCPGLTTLPWFILRLFATTMKHLHIEDCESLTTLPLPDQWLQNLTSLQNFKISRCPSLTKLEGDEANDQEDEINVSGSLQKCWLQNLPNLSEFPRWLVRLSSTSLIHLHVEDCQSLTRIPNQLLQNLTSLEDLRISRCPKLQLNEAKEQEKQSNFASLQRLWIESLPMLSESNWWVIESSAATLEHLHIEDFPTLGALPEWLKNTTSLETIEISRCPKLSSLPEWIRSLTALQQLKIDECPHMDKPFLSKLRLRDGSGGIISDAPRVYLDGDEVSLSFGASDDDEEEEDDVDQE